MRDILHHSFKNICRHIMVFDTLSNPPVHSVFGFGFVDKYFPVIMTVYD